MLHGDYQRLSCKIFLRRKNCGDYRLENWLSVDRRCNRAACPRQRGNRVLFTAGHAAIIYDLFDTHIARSIMADILAGIIKLSIYFAEGSRNKSPWRVKFKTLNILIFLLKISLETLRKASQLSSAAYSKYIRGMIHSPVAWIEEI